MAITTVRILLLRWPIGSFGLCEQIERKHLDWPIWADRAQRDNLWDPAARPVRGDFLARPLACPPTQPKQSPKRRKCGSLVNPTSLSPSFPQNVNSFPHIDNRLSNNGNATSQPISCLRCGRHVQAHIGNLGPFYRNDIQILTPGSQISAIARRSL